MESNVAQLPYPPDRFTLSSAARSAASAALGLSLLAVCACDSDQLDVAGGGSVTVELTDFVGSGEDPSTNYHLVFEAPGFTQDELDDAVNNKDRAEAQDALETLADDGRAVLEDGAFIVAGGATTEDVMTICGVRPEQVSLRLNLYQSELELAFVGDAGTVVLDDPTRGSEGEETSGDSWSGTLSAGATVTCDTGVEETEYTIRWTFDQSVTATSRTRYSFSDDGCFLCIGAQG